MAPTSNVTSALPTPIVEGEGGHEGPPTRSNHRTPVEFDVFYHTYGLCKEDNPRNYHLDHVDETCAGQAWLTLAVGHANGWRKPGTRAQENLDDSHRR